MPLRHRLEAILQSLRTGAAATSLRRAPLRVSGAAIRATWLAGGLAALAILAAASGVLLHRRSREIAATRQISALAAVLAAQTGRDLQSVSLVLDRIVETLRGAGLEGPDDLRRLAAGRGTHEVLRERIGGLTQLDAVTLIALDGRLVNFSRYFPIPTSTSRTGTISAPPATIRR